MEGLFRKRFVQDNGLLPDRPVGAVQLTLWQQRINCPGGRSGLYYLATSQRPTGGCGKQ